MCFVFIETAQWISSLFALDGAFSQLSVLTCRVHLTLYLPTNLEKKKISLKTIQIIVVQLPIIPKLKTWKDESWTACQRCSSWGRKGVRLMMTVQANMSGNVVQNECQMLLILLPHCVSVCVREVEMENWITWKSCPLLAVMSPLDIQIHTWLHLKDAWWHDNPTECHSLL